MSIEDIIQEKSIVHRDLQLSAERWRFRGPATYFGARGKEEGALDCVIEGDTVAVLLNDACQTTTVIPGLTELLVGKTSIEVEYLSKPFPEMGLVPVSINGVALGEKFVPELPVADVRLDQPAAPLIPPPVVSLAPPPVVPPVVSPVTPPVEPTPSHFNYQPTPVEGSIYNAISLRGAEVIGESFRELFGLSQNSSLGSVYSNASDLCAIKYQGVPPKRRAMHFLLPEGQADFLRNGLEEKLSASYDEITFIDSEKVGSFLGRRKKRSNRFVDKLPTFEFEGYEGRTFVMQDHLELILEDLPNTRKGLRKVKGSSKRKSQGVTALADYQPQGRFTETHYISNGRFAPIVTDESGFVLSQVIAPTIAPENLDKKTRKNYIQNLRSSQIRTFTDLTNHYCNSEGKIVDPSEIRQGKKHYVPVSVANNVIAFLVDKGYGTEGEPERKFQFREIGFYSRTPRKRQREQKINVAMVENPNGEYVIGIPKISSALGVAQAVMYELIPRFAENNFVGLTESGDFLVAQGDLEVLNHLTSSSRMPKNYVSHFAQ